MNISDLLRCYSLPKKKPSGLVYEEGFCFCCGGSRFSQNQVLWKELTDAWRLSSDEIYYINRQQGLSCESCHANLRSNALAFALLKYFGLAGVFTQFAEYMTTRGLTLLELNEAGALHQFLGSSNCHHFGEYPEVDMENLPYPDEKFDLVIHSDTLEHITRPQRALSECRRVLKRGGAVIYTVPLIVDRLTVSTVGRPDSFHGSPSNVNSDYMVKTEYGCDAWKDLIKAGFSEIRHYWLEYPSSGALCGVK